MHHLLASSTAAANFLGLAFPTHLHGRHSTCSKMWLKSQAFVENIQVKGSEAHLSWVQTAENPPELLKPAKPRRSVLGCPPHHHRPSSRLYIGGQPRHQPHAWKVLVHPKLQLQLTRSANRGKSNTDKTIKVKENVIYALKAPIIKTYSRRKNQKAMGEK